jgi:hypothetical protein
VGGQLGVGFEADDDFVAIDQFHCHVLVLPALLKSGGRAQVEVGGLLEAVGRVQQPASLK